MIYPLSHAEPETDFYYSATPFALLFTIPLYGIPILLHWQSAGGIWCTQSVTCLMSLLNVRSKSWYVYSQLSSLTTFNPSPGLISFKTVSRTIRLNVSRKSFRPTEPGLVLSCLGIENCTVLLRTKIPLQNEMCGEYFLEPRDELCIASCGFCFVKHSLGLRFLFLILRYHYNAAQISVISCCCWSSDCLWFWAESYGMRTGIFTSRVQCDFL